MKTKTLAGVYIQVFSIIFFLMVNQAKETPWPIDVDPETSVGFPLRFLFAGAIESRFYLLPLSIDIIFCGGTAYILSKLLLVMLQKSNRLTNYIISFLLYILGISGYVFVHYLFEIFFSRYLLIYYHVWY